MCHQTLKEVFVKDLKSAISIQSNWQEVHQEWEESLKHYQVEWWFKAVLESISNCKSEHYHHKLKTLFKFSLLQEFYPLQLLTELFHKLFLNIHYRQLTLIHQVQKHMKVTLEVNSCSPNLLKSQPTQIKVLFWNQNRFSDPTRSKENSSKAQLDSHTGRSCKSNLILHWWISQMG